MSSLTPSINLFFGLPLDLVPGSFKLSIILTVYSLFPNHLNPNWKHLISFISLNQSSFWTETVTMQSFLNCCLNIYEAFFSLLPNTQWQPACNVKPLKSIMITAPDLTDVQQIHASSRDRMLFSFPKHLPLYCLPFMKLNSCTAH